MSAGLETPNYTQVPNVLFEHIADMTETELKCTLAIIRQIIGYHKDKPEAVSYSQLEEMTGLSRQGVTDGVKASLERGYVKIAGKGKRGANLFTLNFVDQSTQQTSTSQDSRLELVNSVDTQKKVSKEKEHTPDGDAPPKPVPVVAPSVADTPSGGQRHVVELPTPETERKRDPIFEVVIARNFGVALDDKAGVEAVRDKANWITSWLKGNAVKKNSRDKRKSLPGCSPPASPEEVGAFYDWWEREKGIDKPSTALGIAQFMSVFRQERKPERTGPAVHFPKPQHRCTVCGDQDTGEGATGMYVGPDGKSIPCPACLAAEQAAQEVRDEQAA